MAVLLSPVGGVAAQFFTNAGVPLSGGKFYTYAAGTSTPQATYTTGAGNIQHSNPIVLDAAGRVPTGEIWLTDGLSYKFVLKDNNDVLIATYDNIVGINSNFVNFVNQQEIQTATANQTVFNLTTMEYQPGIGNLSVFVDGVNQYGPGAQYAYTETDSNTVTFVSGLHVGASVKFTTTEIQNSGIGDASQITYTYPAVDAVQESVEARLAQYVSVKDFGAVGDGVTDDTTAIQNAIDDCYGKGLFFPSGEYLITSQIDIIQTISIYGDYKNSKIVLGTQNQTGFMIGDGTVPTSQACKDTLIYGLTFVPSSSVSASVSGQAIMLDGTDGVVIQNCLVIGTSSANNRDPSAVSKIFTGINVYQSFSFQINNCFITNLVNTGIGINGTSAYPTGGYVRFCEFYTIGGVGIYIGDYAIGNTIVEPIMYNITSYSIQLNRTAGGDATTFIQNPNIEVNSTAAAIKLSSGGGITITGGWIGSGSGTSNQNAIEVDSGVNVGLISGVLFSTTRLTIGGAYWQVQNCDIAGDNTTVTSGVTVNTNADGLMVTGCRIRQHGKWGIELLGTPEYVNINGCNFSSLGYGEIGGAITGSKVMVVTGCQDQTAYTITMAATITTSAGLPFYQATGATTCTTLTVLGSGSRITIQSADAGGITFAQGGNLQLPSSTLTVPLYDTVSFVCDGTSWFFDGKSF